MSARHLQSTHRNASLSEHRLTDIDRDEEAYAESEFGGFKDYDRRKRVKLQNQDALLRQQSGTTDIFKGCVVHINGYTKPSRVDLWHMLVVNGAVYKQYLEGKTDVTHIVATNLTPKKQEDFAKYRVVTPDWIVQSIAQGKCLPWQRYRLYGEKTLDFEATPAVVPVKIDDEHVQAPARSEPTPLHPPQAPLQPPQQQQQQQETRDYIRTATDPDFIQDYYRKSRLHHLSTWKANLRTKIHNLTPQTNKQTVVMHIDFDCFFCAVSSKGKELHGRPCAVTHGGSNSGEIASCNYEARAFGVRNGMWMKEAVQLCPEIVSIGYDFDAYERASDAFYETLLALGAQVEAVSIDEALVNLSDLLPDPDDPAYFDRANAFVSRVRAEISAKTGVQVSAGVGANVLQAKLATRKAKPAGQRCVNGIDGLMEDVEEVPGIGHATAKKLQEAIGTTAVDALRDVPLARLQELLGPKNGESLQQALRGIDSTRVGDISPRKLVSIEINWGIRFTTEEEVKDYMGRVALALSQKLKDVGFVSAAHVLVKVMRRAKDAPIDPPKFLGHGRCDKVNNGREISDTGDPATLHRHAYALLKALEIPPDELRGIGVALTRLKAVTPTRQSSFKFPEARPQKSIPTTSANLAAFATTTSTRKRTAVQPTLATTSHSATTTLTNLDMSVLAALPDDIRREVLAEERLMRQMDKRKRVQTRLLTKAAVRADAAKKERLLNRKYADLPPPPDHLTQGDLATASTHEILDYLSSWIAASTAEHQDQPPDEDDWRDFENYLHLIDVDRACAIVDWLDNRARIDDGVGHGWRERIRALRDL
ncbi:deoxycytidyl transferase [Savitreella phatthalungensis]